MLQSCVYAYISGKQKLFIKLVFGALLAASLGSRPALAQETVTHPAKVYSYGMFGAFAFSPDGTRIALAHSNAISLLDARTLERLDTFFTTHYGPLGERYNGDIASIAFSPDGEQLAVADGAATVFNVSTGAVVFTIDAAAGAHSVAFSHNGAYLFTGSSGGDAALWNAATGAWVRTFTGHTDTINATAFSHDDTQVLTGSEDNTAILWDVASGQAVRTLADHTDGVAAVAFMPDGTTAVTGSFDGTVRRWDATGPVVLTAPDRVASLAVSAEFIVAYTCAGSISLWDSARAEELGEFMPNPTADLGGNADTVRQVAFSPDGTRLLSGSAESKHIRLWDTTEWSKVVKCVGHTDWLTSVAFSPDGTKVLTGSHDNTARLWTADAGTALQTFTGHTDFVYSVAFSPDGEKVLTGSRDGTAKVWDANTGTVLFNFTGHTDAVYSVAFSPNGAKALTGSRDGTAKLWDATTGTVSQTFGGGDTVEVTSWDVSASRRTPAVCCS